MLLHERKNVSKVSKEIAKVLTQGGKLLADTCPNCSTPLVQTRSGMTVCVNCGWSTNPNKDIVNGPVQHGSQSFPGLRSIVEEVVNSYSRRLSNPNDVDPQDLKVIFLALSILQKLDQTDVEESSIQGSRHE